MAKQRPWMPPHMREAGLKEKARESLARYNQGKVKLDILFKEWIASGDITNGSLGIRFDIRDCEILRFELTQGRVLSTGED